MCDYSLVFIKKDGSKEKVMESVELVTKKRIHLILPGIYLERKRKYQGILLPLMDPKMS